MLILQGAGINMQRGAEELVEAMQYVNNAVLYIVGSGDVIDILKEMVENYHLQDKVIMTGKVPFQELINYTVHGDLGLTLDKDTNINYRYSLPNKLFDYIQAGVPVLASRLTEISKVIDTYQIGGFIDNHDPKHIASKINSILSDQPRVVKWKENLQKAANELNWDLEEEKLKEVYQKYV
ncbi:MAG: glycosyltransferase [Bacteroidales bacterium]